MREVKEEYEGQLIVPQQVVRQYEMGQVIAIGDGHNRATGTRKNIPVAVGDVVWFQVNPAMKWHNVTKVDGEAALHIHAHDVLAKISGKVLKRANFQVVGSWVLLRGKLKTKGVIVIPDNASGDSVELQYFIDQVGEEASHLPVGKEAIIDKKMAHAVDIGDEKFFYIEAAHVHGYQN